MKNCYELLEIAPTASTEEIEEAYQRKKKEFLLASTGDAARQQELDSAYNDAIMATFAPIRAFASPLPPLITRKSSPPDVQATPVQPVPVQIQTQVQIQPQFQHETPEIEHSEPPQTQTPIQPAQPANAPEAQPQQSAYISHHSDESTGQKTQKPTTFMSFTDTQIMNMDISEMKNHIPQDEIEGDDAGEPFLGIENKLLRYYAKTYIAVLVFDMVMRLLFGSGWLVFAESVSAEYIPSISRLLLVPLAFVSIAYCFICALPIPFAARFLVMGQPPDKNSIMWSLFFISITSAFLLHWLTGRILPHIVTGSAASLIIAAIALSLKTLQYEGD